MRRPARLEREARDRDRAVTLVATWELDDVERETFRVPERETTTRASAGPGVEPVILFGGLRNVLEQYEHGSTWGKVDFFPCSRQLPRRPVGRMPKMRTELQESLLRLSATADKYDGLWGWLDEELSRTMRLRDEEVRSRGVVFADDVVESLAWLRDSFGSFPCATRFRGVSATEGGLEFETERGAVLATEALSGSARRRFYSRWRSSAYCIVAPCC